MASSSVQSRLGHLGRSTYVSQSALAQVLKELNDIGVIDFKPSRRTIKRARDEAIAIDTTSGSLLVPHLVKLHSPAEVKEVSFVNPCALLVHLTSSCDHFARFIFKKLTDHPCSIEHPWRIIFYSDEISFGNQLKPNNQRKLQGIYWSFAEFDTPFLSSESAWFFLTAIRSSVVTRMAGGMSELFRQLLPLFAAQGRDLSKGLFLHSAEHQGLLFAEPAIMISDESALKQAWAVKGASGTLCCMLCRNVVKPESELHITDSTGFLIPLTELDPSRFCCHTNNSIRDAALTLSAAEPNMNKTAFNQLQQTLGLNHCPTGLLWSTENEPTLPFSSVMFDWMHIYLVSGIFQIEMSLLLALLTPLRITHVDLHRWCSSFSFPKRLESKSASKNVFEKKPNAGDFKCSASDGLSIYGLVRLFLMRQFPHAPSNEIKLACSSFYLLCNVLDLLTKISHGENVPELHLLTAITSHLKAFKLVHGEDPFVPKFHMAIHLPSMMAHHKLLLSCFVHERKHKELKRYGSDTDNTSSSYEKGILKSVLHVHFEMLQQADAYPSILPTLVKPSPAPSNLSLALQFELGIVGEVLVSDVSFYGEMKQCSKDDFATYTLEGSIALARVRFHVQIGDHRLTCLTSCKPLGNNSFQLEVDDVFFVNASDILETFVYRLVGNIALVVPKM
jgi:hypothetical protein